MIIVGRYYDYHLQNPVYMYSHLNSNKIDLLKLGQKHWLSLPASKTTTKPTGIKGHLSHQNSTEVLQRKQLGILEFGFLVEKYKMAVGNTGTETAWRVWDERHLVAMLASFRSGTGF